MNGICILVPQANSSDGGFAKLAPLLRTVLFLFYFIFYCPGCGSCGTATIFFLVCNGCFLVGVEERNNREKKTKIFLSEQIPMMS